MSGNAPTFALLARSYVPPPDRGVSFLRWPVIEGLCHRRGGGTGPVLHGESGLVAWSRRPVPHAPSRRRRRTRTGHGARPLEGPCEHALRGCGPWVTSLWEWGGITPRATQNGRCSATGGPTGGVPIRAIRAAGPRPPPSPHRAPYHPPRTATALYGLGGSAGDREQLPRRGSQAATALGVPLVIAPCVRDRVGRVVGLRVDHPVHIDASHGGQLGRHRERL